MGDCRIVRRSISEQAGGGDDGLLAPPRLADTRGTWARCAGTSWED